ncbi:hypothetical protein [Aeromicrobium sp. Leaf350]|uniref:hypothetical protein n=1 Tax=Aeromicrobium sp. Leaf350 TaxID=2876565 RepID=UPI001E3E205E|nr:hypothetical protein [Aeromicrobium sp. Leaf350]
MLITRVLAGFATFGALLVLIGSVGTWASFGGFTKGGLEGDGVITLVLAVLIGGFAGGVFAPLSVARVMRWFVLPFGFLALLVAIIDVVDISSSGNEFASELGVSSLGLTVGWGLWVVLIGAVTAVVAGLLLTIAPMPRPLLATPWVPTPYSPQPYPQPYPPQAQPYPPHPGAHPPQPAPQAPAWPTTGPAYPGSTGAPQVPTPPQGPPPPPPSA